MLSLKRCRELLGKEIQLPDKELEVLLTHLYQLGGVALQMATQPKKVEHAQEPSTPSPPSKVVLNPAKQKRGRRTHHELHCGRFN